MSETWSWKLKALWCFQIDIFILLLRYDLINFLLQFCYLFLFVALEAYFFFFFLLSFYSEVLCGPDCFFSYLIIFSVRMTSVSAWPLERVQKIHCVRGFFFMHAEYVRKWQVKGNRWKPPLTIVISARITPAYNLV